MDWVEFDIWFYSIVCRQRGDHNKLMMNGGNGLDGNRLTRNKKSRTTQ